MILPAAGVACAVCAGDSSALPAFLAMAGSLPVGQRATVILEVPGPGDEQELTAAADVELAWLHSDGRPPGDPAVLAGAGADLPPPPPARHAHLARGARPGPA